MLGMKGRWPLKFVLLVPFCVLLLALAATIGWRSFHTGAQAVHDLEGQLLADMAQRVDQAVGDHLKAADIVLNAFAPDRAADAPRGAAPPFDYANDLALEARFFELTGITEGVRYMYMGRPNGDFVGVEREASGAILSKFRNARHPQRINYAIRQPGDRGVVAGVDADYDPLTRPWYKVAASAGALSWTPLYVSYAKKDLMVTRAKPVKGANGEVAGIVAVDVPLDGLSLFMRKLQISPNGVALIMEPDGRLIATSTSEPPYVMSSDGSQARLAGQESRSPLVRATVTELLAARAARGDPEVRGTAFSFDGGTVHVAVKRMQAVRTSGAGSGRDLDWIIAVAAPQSDFTGDIVKATVRTTWLLFVALLVILFAGFMVVRWVTRDIGTLTAAAERFGRGEPVGDLPVKRGDEIGILARAFSAMAGEITELIDAIRRQNDQLEAGIAGRTRVLSEQNRRLAEEIRERQAAEQRTMQLFNIVEQTDEGILVCEADGQIRYVNPGFTRLTGYTLEDLQGESGNASLLASARYDPATFDAALQQEIRRTVGDGKTWRGVVRARHKSGESYHAEITITPVMDGQTITALTAIERDVSQRELAREAVLNRLQIDSLTGLLNRDSITKRLADLNRENFERRLAKPHVAILFMDLDGFKAVNDTYGHDAGDAALIEAASRIQGCVRASDAVARLGGDEFLAVLGNTPDRAAAQAVAAKIDAEFGEPFLVGHAAIRLGVSIGIGMFPEDAHDFEGLMRVADQAMYAAKRERRLRK
jgi:diguanylate cyclase (GGDEF)-like protein/PAS domain S-box-containing protein